MRKQLLTTGSFHNKVVKWPFKPSWLLCLLCESETLGGSFLFDFVFDRGILECVLEVAFWDSFNVLQGALSPEASPAPIVGPSNLFSWTWPHTKPLINMVGALISVF